MPRGSLDAGCGFAGAAVAAPGFSGGADGVVAAGISAATADGAAPLMQAASTNAARGRKRLRDIGGGCGAWSAAGAQILAQDPGRRCAAQPRDGLVDQVPGDRNRARELGRK